MMTLTPSSSMRYVFRLFPWKRCRHRVNAERDMGCEAQDAQGSSTSPLTYVTIKKTSQFTRVFVFRDDASSSQVQGMNTGDNNTLSLGRTRFPDTVVIECMYPLLLFHSPPYPPARRRYQKIKKPIEACHPNAS